MEKILRRTSLKKLLPQIIVCILLAIVLLAVTGLGAILLLIGPTDLTSLDLSDASGRYVSVDASQALAGFATYSNGSDVSKEYFVLDIGNGQYMAISAKSDTMDLLEAAGDQAEDFYVNAAIDTINPMGTVSGTIVDLPEELRDYFDDAIASIAAFVPELEGVEDLSSVTVYSCLEVGRVGLLPVSAVIVLTIIALVLLVLGLLQLVLALGGFYQRESRAILAQYLHTDTDRADAEKDFSDAQCIEHVRVGHVYTWYQAGAKTMVLANSQIVWAYCQIEPLVVSKYRWPMCIWMRDGVRLEPHLQEQRSVQKILDTLASNGFHILTGYDADRLRLCTQNFPAFLAAADQELAE